MNFKNSKSTFIVFALVLLLLGKNVFVGAADDIPIGVRDVREKNFPEKITKAYAQGISAKTDSVVYLYLDNGTYSENQDTLYDNFDAKDIDVIKELRDAARLSVKNGAKFNRIVQANSETGTDRIIIYIDGNKVSESRSVTPTHGAVTSRISKNTIELWNVVQESNRKWGAKHKS